jgi:hypothetical protein
LVDFSVGCASAPPILNATVEINGVTTSFPASDRGEAYTEIRDPRAFA